MPPKVVIIDNKQNVMSLYREPLEDIGAEIEVLQTKDIDEAIDAIEDPTALIVDATLSVTGELLESAESLEVVGRAGIGLDNIDMAAALENDITVVNTPKYCLDEISTHTLALLLGCIRKVRTYDENVRNGEWNWEVGTPIHRMAGSTLGFIAYGNIARAVTEKLEGFDLKLIAYDPYVSASEMDDHGVTKVSFDELCARSEYITMHTPLTSETMGMIDETAFSKMNDDAILINTSRGPTIEEEALEPALRNDEIGAAGLDVTPVEPPGDGSPLLEIDNVLLSPHVGWYSEEAQDEVEQAIATNVARVLAGEDPPGKVDPDQEWLHHTYIEWDR